MEGEVFGWNPRRGTGCSGRVSQRSLASGISEHVVGLGADVGFELLLDVAGSPRRLHVSPSPGELEAIYTEIARSIPCPAGAYWGRR